MSNLRLIAGSGRSGTTWVLDAIAEANGLRPVFEPLHPDSSGISRELCYAYLTRESENTELTSLFMSIVNNSFRSVWTSYRIRPVRLRLTRKHLHSPGELKSLMRSWHSLARRFWSYRQRERGDSVLVKCIRANLMLDWLHENFKPRIVLLMRHPCAVVESQMRFQEHWDPCWLLAKYRKDEALMEGPLRGRVDLLNKELTKAQALAAIWCIENLVPASQAAANGYTVAFYEELLEQPELEWQRIAQGLGVPVTPGPELLQQPSQQSAVRLQKREMSDDSYSESYGSWRKGLPTTDVRQIADVLDAFELDFYSTTENRPNVASFNNAFLST